MAEHCVLAYAIRTEVSFNSSLNCLDFICNIIDIFYFTSVLSYRIGKIFSSRVI